MQSILRRLPTTEGLERNKPKIAGFALGVILPVVAAMFFHALRTGEGLYPEPSTPVVIYPNI